MISALLLRNFKCFRHQQIPLANLTLLAGLNGAGKSSVLQALTIVRQSFKSGYLSRSRLLLAGDLVDLGTGIDILYEDATEDLIGIDVETSSGGSANLSFQYDRKADQLLAENGVDDAIRALSEEPIFGDNFYYLHADRYGPRKTLPMSEAKIRDGQIGISGEYVLHAIIARGAELLEPTDPRGRGAATRSLADQVDAWLQEISPGSHLNIEVVRAADMAIAGFRFDREGDIPTRPFRSTNVGYGLSYSLAVIYALLAAAPGALVLLENPEAHLHPRGQTVLGHLVACAAAAGVQVLVESHSDHFMDGIRIGVRQGVITPEHCVFNYFSRSGALSSVSSPVIDSDGRLSFWPEGFFDQHEENLSALISPKV